MSGLYVARRRVGEIIAAQASASLPVTTPDPTTTDPSGVAMPTTAPTGWTPLFRQNFNTNVAAGNFPSVYGSGSSSFNATEALTFGRVNSYPTWGDTRSKGSPVDGHWGIYNPNNLSAVGGSMNMHIWWDPSINNMSVACPVAKLSNIGSWGDIGNCHTMVRARYVGTNRNTTKVAWLQWPTNNHSTTLATAGVPDSSSSTGFRGGDGEVDWPEQDEGSIAQAFMHKQNALSTDTSSTPTYGDKQVAFNSTVNFFDGNWHTWERFRKVGSYSSGTWVDQDMEFWVDGNRIGQTTTRVPMTTMRENLQSETTLNQARALDQTVNYTIEVDWWVVDTQ